MKTCEVCGAAIPEERLELLPGTRTCVGCSREQRKVGFMISEFSKGTAPALVTVDPANTEDFRRAVRANRRRR